MQSPRWRRTLYALWGMSRPGQMLAVTLVYLFGAVIALANRHPFDLRALAWGYLALFPAAASIHYANEYADRDTDALTTRTPFSGGSGALLRTDLPPVLALKAAWASAAVSGLAAAAGAAAGILGPSALIVLASGIVFGWMYSLRPLALAWRGWGELDNAALGGVLLPIFGYTILAGRIDPAAVLAVAPFGLLVFVNLLATTWPDRKADAAVGKNTLATRWTPRTLRLVYWAAAAAAFLMLPLLADRVLPPIVAWACALTVPLVVWGAVAYTRQSSPLPTVAAMVVMLIAHLLGWAAAIG